MQEVNLFCSADRAEGRLTVDAICGLARNAGDEHLSPERSKHDHAKLSCKGF